MQSFLIHSSFSHLFRQKFLFVFFNDRNTSPSAFSVSSTIMACLKVFFRFFTSCLFQASYQSLEEGFIVSKFFSVTLLGVLLPEGAPSLCPLPLVFSRNVNKHFQPSAFFRAVGSISAMASKARPVRFEANRGPKSVNSSSFTPSAKFNSQLIFKPFFPRTIPGLIIEIHTAITTVRRGRHGTNGACSIGRLCYHADALATKHKTRSTSRSSNR